MAALLSVKRPKTGTELSWGHMAASTCGMVSPTMTPKATMPPKANTHCATLMAMRPARPKQCSTVPWKLLVPLSLLLMTMRQMVQSTTAVSPTSSTMPDSRPAWRMA